MQNKNSKRLTTIRKLLKQDLKDKWTMKCKIWETQCMLYSKNMKVKNVEIKTKLEIWQTNYSEEKLTVSNKSVTLIT